MTTRPRVIAGMATMPGREASLARAVESLAPQVAELRLHVNEASTVELPTLPENVICLRSPDNRGDQEKLLVATCGARADWVVTADDDLVYPPTFVEELVDVARCYADLERRPVVVSAHGSRLCSPFVSYYRSRVSFHCTQAVSKTERVDVIGTGCALFPAQVFAFVRSDFPAPNMADVWTSIYLAERGIPRYVVRHPARWLELGDATNTATIWHASRRADGSFMDTGAAQTEAIRARAALFGLEVADGVG